jgi:hypothetical protein
VGVDAAFNGRARPLKADPIICVQSTNRIAIPPNVRLKDAVDVLQDHVAIALGRRCVHCILL